MKKRIIILISALFTLTSLAAQSIEELLEQIPIPENVGQLYVKFNFAHNSNMLEMNISENRHSMDTLCMVVNTRIIEDGTVLVDGYGKDDKMVGTRCNKIKSELMTKIGMKEANFKTTKHMDNYKGEDDVVTVTIPSNVMASALRDFEIMRILSTPRIITVVEDVPTQTETQTDNETFVAPPTQIAEQNATDKSAQPTLKYATRITKQKISKKRKQTKRLEGLNEPKQSGQLKSVNNDNAVTQKTVAPSKLKYATRIYPSKNKK